MSTAQNRHIFESATNRQTFETNVVITTPSIQAQMKFWIVICEGIRLKNFQDNFETIKRLDEQISLGWLWTFLFLKYVNFEVFHLVILSAIHFLFLRSVCTT